MKLIVAPLLIIVGIVLLVGAKEHGPLWVFLLGLGAVGAGLVLIVLIVRDELYIPGGEGKVFPTHPESLDRRIVDRVKKGGTPHN